MGKASRKVATDARKTTSSRMGYLLAAIIVVAVFVAYWPAIHGGFIWDDEEYVSKNELLTAPDGLKRIWFSTDSPSQYFPLVYTTFRVERAIWDLDTTGYHVTNIILHILNALLVWLILKKLSVKGAWLAAAIFALHPVHVESVAWITERKNVLSTLFYLLTVLSWMRFREGATRDPLTTPVVGGRPDDGSRQGIGDWRFYGLAIALSALALSAKTTAATVPAALLLVSWLRRERIGWREFALMTPFVALGVGAGLVSIWWEKNKQGTTGEMFDFSIADRVLIAGRALWFYLWKLIWPVRLAFSYARWNIDPSQPLQYLWPAGCAAVAGALWWFRRTVGRGPIAAGIFFVAALVPMLGFFSLFTFRYAFVADHYQYIASVGPIALIAAGLTMLAERMRAQQAVRYVVPGLIIAVLGALTWSQAHAYENLEQLWRHTIANSPKSWMAYNNLATLLNEESRYDEARPFAEEAVRLNPDSWTGQATMGHVLVHEARFEEAIPYFTKAIELRPDWAAAYYDYGVALQQINRTDEAIEQYGKAIQLKPDYPEARLNLGAALSDAGMVDQAISEFHEVIALRPDFPNVHRNLAMAYYLKGMYREAWSEVQLADQNGDAPNPQLVQALQREMADPY